MEEYFYKMELIIHNILTKKTKTVFNYDILDLDDYNIKELVLKQKQKQMKIGLIWEEVIGNYDGFVKLKIGNKTGLDIISYSKKIIIEIKNRTNTDNNSSRKCSGCILEITSFNSLEL